ncbi:MAG: T9SS type A sorting domain-containing protein [candidate division WOR-3 bacterium]
MKKIIPILIPYVLFSQIQDTIFGSKWEGIKIQEFIPSPSPIKIDSFRTYTSGEWVILSVYATTGQGIASGDILSAKISGISVDSAKVSGNIRFKGFKVSGPDQEGYVYLNIVRANGTTKPILRTKLAETKVDSFYVTPNPPDTFYQFNYHLKGFSVAGPDQNGYVWLIAILSTIGTFSSKSEEIKIPDLKFELKEVSPNPAREFTRITYSIPEDLYVKIYVYDKTGKIVKRIVDKYERKGIYRIFWGLCDENNNLLPDGEYFIKFEAGKFKSVKKILILK